MIKPVLKEQRRRIRTALLTVTVSLFIIICLAGFFHFIRTLKNSLRDERAVYVNELTGQVTRSITAKREWLMSRIGSSASAFEQSEVDSFSEAARLFSYKSEENYTVLLVADTGTTYTLNGKTAQIRNFDILSATLQGEKTQYHFDKSSDGIDYWVFTANIEPRFIDGIMVTAIYEIYDVEQFHDDLHLGLFGNDGYTYIIELDGGIQLGPKKAADFIGYNLISSLRKAGMDTAAADRLEAELKQKKGNSLFASLQGTDWAIQYEPLTDSNEMVVVIAPIAETSKETTKALQYTLATIACVVLGLAALVLYIIILNVRASRERNRQMYELELKERVASTKNDFLAKMSHDIRTPLNAIIGMNYIATTQVDKASPVQESLKQIDLSAKFLLGILNDILDMSKIESGKMELRNAPFIGRDVVDAVVGISIQQAEEKGVRFDVSIDKQLSAAYIGDRQRLTQILMNLTSNAVKFTERGDRIEVKFTLEEREEKKDRIRLSVSDTGIGMNPEFLELLLVPFAQDSTGAINSTGGSGLGLSIVKSFVDMMGGDITVESKKGEGSVFNLVLTLERTTITECVTEKAQEQLDESILKQKRVLLVEDNHVNLLIAQTILTKFGLKVETARNGVAALENYTASEPHYFDMIITDIKMPEMNGYELTVAIRKLERPDAKTIPILAMSANAFDDDIQESLSHGMNAHLKKPIDVAELKATLMTYLAGGEPHA